ncbi:MAG: hypothetical protein WB797_07575 [Nocardioides sp.]
MTDHGARASDDATAAEPWAEPGAGSSVEPSVGPPIEAPAPVAADDAEPSWWHRSHPTFAGLMGFFSGVAYVIVVPGVYAALLGLLVSESTATELFPLVLIALVVPLAMLVHHKTRRFARYMFLGIVSTVVVVAVTAALVIWVMVKLGQ